jgi:hypothetical protein
MSLLTVERELVKEIKAGIETAVGDSYTYYSQWEEVKEMPCVVVSSEGGQETEDTSGIFAYGILITILTEPDTTGEPEASHYTLANDVLDYCYDTAASGITLDDTSVGSWRVDKTHSSIDKGRVFRTELSLEIIAKPTNF